MIDSVNLPIQIPIPISCPRANNIAIMWKKFILTICLLVWRVSHAGAQPPQGVVYRGDTMPPADVKRQGGFVPKGMDMSRRPFAKLASTSLYDHVNGDNQTGQAPDNSGYVSTSSDIRVARRAVQSYGGSGFVYYIRPSSNFIDADATLGRYHPRPTNLEDEFSALWGIDFSQVVGWMEITGGADMGYTSNPDFNATAYLGATAGGVRPELAGFIRSHVAWLEHPWRDYTNCECDHQNHSTALAMVDQRYLMGRTVPPPSPSRMTAFSSDDQRPRRHHPHP